MFKWDPEFGKLFIREIWSAGEVREAHLGCIVAPRAHPNASLPYLCLLESTMGVTSPKGFGSVCHEYVTGKEEWLNENRRVSRRLALGQDIEILLKDWDSKERTQPDEWISWVRKRCCVESRLLSQTEFDKLNEFAQAFAVPHPLNRYQG